MPLSSIVGGGIKTSVRYYGVQVFNMLQWHEVFEINNWSVRFHISHDRTMHQFIHIKTPVKIQRHIRYQVEISSNSKYRRKRNSISQLPNLCMRIRIL